MMAAHGVVGAAAASSPDVHADGMEVAGPEAPVPEDPTGQAVDALTDAVAVAAVVWGDKQDRVAELEQRRRELQKQRKELNKTIKNEQRKHKRIMDKAKTLSDAELLAVVASRQAKAKAKPKAKGKAKAAAKAMA